jgi:glycosyltransferase involved in cell wall biosynthesis
MNVTIDTNSRHTTQAGTTRYLEGLLRGLRQLANPELQIEELSWPVDNLSYEQPQRSMKTIYRELIWPWLIARPHIAVSRPNIFHSPTGFFVSPCDIVPHVVTLHDLAMFRYPERFRPWQRFSGPFRLRKLQRATHIIAISQFTADEAIKFLGISPQMLSIIHHGCDFSRDSPEQSLKSLSLPSSFFLFVGSLEPGKNLSLLRESYLLAEKNGYLLPPLVVVGARWNGVEREGRWPISWIQAGRVDDAELVYLYRRAIALLFPSKYEGFGFPPLEAMTLGCPVVCSRSASIPEVVGSAALFSELTPESFLDAMKCILETEPLRSDLIAAGRERSVQFSWNKCAIETLNVYRKFTK